MPGFFQERFDALAKWADGLNTTDGKLASLTIRELCAEVRDCVTEDEFDAELRSC